MEAAEAGTRGAAARRPRAPATLKEQRDPRHGGRPRRRWAGGRILRPGHVAAQWGWSRWAPIPGPRKRAGCPGRRAAISGPHAVCAHGFCPLPRPAQRQARTGSWNPGAISKAVSRSKNAGRRRENPASSSARWVDPSSLAAPPPRPGRGSTQNILE